ncbi:MAG: hypothetical protein Q9164_002806 [Protoblastenia rupestris]
MPPRNSRYDGGYCPPRRNGMPRYDHYESPSTHRGSHHTDRHGHSARPSTTGSHRRGNDPLARWNLWDQPQLIDALIIQMYIAENGGNTRFEGGVDEVANERAQFDSGITGRHMSPRDVIDIYRWLQVNTDHPQNPYSRWERACGAFASGANGDPYDIPVVRGEFSVADVENYLARLILDYMKQKLGPEIARELEACTHPTVGLASLQILLDWVVGVGVGVIYQGLLLLAKAVRTAITVDTEDMEIVEGTEDVEDMEATEAMIAVKANENTEVIGAMEETRDMEEVVRVGTYQIPTPNLTE